MPVLTVFATGVLPPLQSVVELLGEVVSPTRIAESLHGLGVGFVLDCSDIEAVLVRGLVEVESELFHEFLTDELDCVKLLAGLAATDSDVTLLLFTHLSDVLVDEDVGVFISFSRAPLIIAGALLGVITRLVFGVVSPALLLFTTNLLSKRFPEAGGALTRRAL